MLKTQLIRRLAEQHPHVSLRGATQAYGVIMETICTALQNGERVELRGFGALWATTRDARSARNPKTFEAVDIPERRAVRFRASRAMSRRLAPDDPE